MAGASLSNYGTVDWQDFYHNWREADANWLQLRSILRFETTGDRDSITSGVPWLAGTNDERVGTVVYLNSANTLQWYQKVGSTYQWANLLSSSNLVISDVGTFAKLASGNNDPVIHVKPTSVTLGALEFLTVGDSSATLTSGPNSVVMTVTSTNLVLDKALTATGVTSTGASTFTSVSATSLTSSGTLSVTGLSTLGAVTAGALTATGLVSSSTVTATGAVSSGIARMQELTGAAEFASTGSGHTGKITLTSTAAVSATNVLLTGTSSIKVGFNSSNTADVAGVLIGGTYPSTYSAANYPTGTLWIVV